MAFLKKVVKIIWLIGQYARTAQAYTTVPHVAELHLSKAARRWRTTKDGRHTILVLSQALRP
jgi:hypothetical protein